MFQIGDVLISDDVAKARFACDLGRCKGACCVLGAAGAPLKRSEIPVINKAWKTLRNDVRERAREVVADEGLIRNIENAPELNFTDGADCVFVVYEGDVAFCSIQKAYEEGRFNWPKPVSCHLYPLRITDMGSVKMINYEYIPSMCGPACDRGGREGIYLSDFLEDALIREFGSVWYKEFQATCRKMREGITLSI
ncbi:MAG: DUF3109 family protein [Balneolaceae bacterium]|nr:MAG: DUF3109 family protein [Balneolaceae bacterium]